jgi:hypothetical protein
MGECGHPTDQSLARQSKIDGTLVQVWHKKIWMDGDLVKAYVTGASNDYGKSFDMDLRRGQVPAFSLRAIGSLVNENGCMTVRHLQPITWDRVYYPSHSKAYMTKIVSNESVSVSPKVFYEIAEGEYYHSKQTEINQVSEAGNCPMGEELIIPLTQSEISNYLMQESTNVQTAISTFDVLYESIQLNPSLNTVTMKTRMGDTFHICLEDAVKREVLDGIAKFF